MKKLPAPCSRCHSRSVSLDAKGFSLCTACGLSARPKATHTPSKRDQQILFNRRRATAQAQQRRLPL